MIKVIENFLCLFVWFVLAGCAGTAKVSKLVYAKNLTVGINVSAAGANPDFTIGMRSQNLAIVPVYSEKKDKTILGNVGGTNAGDALSVLGQFSNKTAGAEVSLGEFFATGLAAQKLADGFACKLGYCPDDLDNGTIEDDEAIEDDDAD